MVALKCSEFCLLNSFYYFLIKNSWKFSYDIGDCRETWSTFYLILVLFCFDVLICVVSAPTLSGLCFSAFSLDTPLYKIKNGRKKYREKQNQHITWKHNIFLGKMHFQYQIKGEEKNHQLFVPFNVPIITRTK